MIENNCVLYQHFCSVNPIYLQISEKVFVIFYRTCVLCGRVSKTPVQQFNLAKIITRPGLFGIRNLVRSDRVMPDLTQIKKCYFLDNVSKWENFYIWKSTNGIGYKFEFLFFVTTILMNYFFFIKIITSQVLVFQEICAKYLFRGKVWYVFTY